MFPTSGLFQEFPCPMFAAGHCDRPYCHFNHSNPPDQMPSNLESLGAKACPKPDPPPVYRPTPINILEKRVEHETGTQIGQRDTNGLDSLTDAPRIPVYQPTPISELEKYAPGSISAYAFAKPSDPPSYSPVIPPKITPDRSYPSSDSSGQLTPRSYIYQPSPAYPPATDKDLFVSPKQVERDDRISGTTWLSKEGRLSPDVDGFANESAKRKSDTTVHLPAAKKMKHKSRDATVDESKTSTTLTKKSTAAEGAAQTTAISVDESESEEEEGKAEPPGPLRISKREKLLALYHDLYGDTSTEELKKPKKDLGASRANPIIPYLGTGLLNSPGREEKPCASTSSAGSEKKGAAEPAENVPRPRVPLRKSDKIPMPIRTRYLDQFIEECLAIYQRPSDAYDRALNDEQACHDKATSRMAYLNAVIQRLKSLKSEKLKVENEGLRKQGSRKPDETSDPAKQSKKPLSVETLNMEHKLDEAVQGPLLYRQLKPYILSEEDLVANGFPREDKSPGAPRGRALLSMPENKRVEYSTCQKKERICCRCGTRFMVDEFGNALVRQKCVYHWSKPVKQRVPGRGIEIRHLCCHGEAGQPGCQICPAGHVHEANKWLDNEGFVTTLPPLVPEPSAGDGEAVDPPVNVYALDCEMVYTTGGCELARVTIVDAKLSPILDMIVRPDNPVIDCNTRFSGLKQEEVEQSTDRITDVQSRLLHLFDSDSILIGHSLESDLTALKIIHSKVVDTSVMFPHRLGPPKKRALRNLVGEYLQQIIQQDDKGHNSLEDAVACMQLVQYKAKDDLRRGKWTLK
ncbi:unnamed protein product [Calicophoron daubneyi]|uniref:C3H1-type domain-containing protein n=1 Tax=Calicophoron daubneyi TaxID=300641 RepID=A0AAV2TTL6_CALDB